MQIGHTIVCQMSLNIWNNLLRYLRHVKKYLWFMADLPYLSGGNIWWLYQISAPGIFSSMKYHCFPSFMANNAPPSPLAASLMSMRFPPHFTVVGWYGSSPFARRNHQAGTILRWLLLLLSRPSCISKQSVHTTGGSLITASPVIPQSHGYYSSPDYAATTNIATQTKC